MGRRLSDIGEVSLEHIQTKIKNIELTLALDREKPTRIRMHSKPFSNTESAVIDVKSRTLIYIRTPNINGQRPFSLKIEEYGDNVKQVNGDENFDLSGLCEQTYPDLFVCNALENLPLKSYDNAYPDNIAPGVGSIRIRASTKTAGKFSIHAIELLD